MAALSKIREAGFNINLDGDSIVITPSSKLTQTQRDFLKSHKAEIIGELKSLLVTCYSPSGLVYEIEAQNLEHAQWLKKMNPKRSSYGE
ncbi:MAG: hypothetical protein D0528_01145 [Methylococcales bacterium]|nr:MAG: hypothetical protein D0528_01145 [Methylococcales bacterium]